MNDKDWVMMDLFSGLGGASEAFVLNGWDVYRYDNNEIFTDPDHENFVPHTSLWDAFKQPIPFPCPDNVDFLWASPPCQDFTLAYGGRRATAEREGIPFEPDMRPLEITMNILEVLKPRYWAIENVVGASKYFAEHLGKHRVKLGSAMIWGNFPVVGFVEVDKKWKRKNDDSEARYSPIRSNLRAKMPLWMSEQMRVAVQYQMMISDFEASLEDVSWAYSTE